MSLMLVLIPYYIYALPTYTSPQSSCNMEKKIADLHNGKSYTKFVDDVRQVSM